ncbi:Ppx/GppA phosphatase family protein [Ulvibacter antarcticus]|uniref:Ppx/GppA phosphatase family protein n=1 Tax=Ulvibacter antarcticus TaxID=442714 RepID=A0A3L9ZLR9_9FLAO|nr:ethanolamine ammonia-lyase reactivating factor EutA [Ulvibacter antarcticus]RMA67692.1 Ppx/GppA phosphatase family protein [Ulvibacter antarcticus]
MNNNIIGNDLIFIELGSYATKILDWRGEENLCPPIVNPYNLISIEGNFQLKVFNKSVIYRLKKRLKELTRPTTKIIAFATGIYRNSTNANTSLKILCAIPNLELFVLTPKEEVLLSCNSILKSNNKLTNKIVYIDIGGGSTEIAYLLNGDLIRFVSIDLGLLLMTVHFFHHSSNIHSGLTKINDKFEKVIEPVKGFLEDIGLMIYENECTVLVTGMVVKKIDKKYLNDNTIEFNAYSEYLDFLQLILTKYDDIQDLNNSFKKSENCKMKLSMYLGGAFLHLLLIHINAQKFKINFNGLSNGFRQQYLKKINKS